MSPPLHITIVTSALALSACGVDTAAPDATLLDAGKDAQVTTEEDAASGDASQVHEGDGDASSTGNDAEVTQRPCNDACSGATPYCDEQSDTCVACLDSTQCAGDPSAPRCEQGACVPCETNDHCSGVTSGAVALGVCDQGSCVECTGTQYDACGPNVCDSKARTCSNQAPASQELCMPCVSDAACKPGTRCIAMRFSGSDVGAFCLWEEGAGQGGAPENCGESAPFVEQFKYASIDGYSATYCSLAVTTCPAYKDFRNTKPNACDKGNHSDEACGIEGVNDGLCRVFTNGTPPIYACTTPCTSIHDCRPNYACITEGASGYCALQTTPQPSN